MTTFKAPPNQSDLVLQNGDILLVEAMGTATNTQIKMGGLERVFAGGTSENTTIDLLGRERVDADGTSNHTTIHNGAREIVFGTSNNTDIVGGIEVVELRGVAHDTTIGGNFGRLDVTGAGRAHNVTFSDKGIGSVELGNPLALTGTITNWHIRDFIDLEETRVTGVINSIHNTVTVIYGQNRSVTYTLVDQQPDTEVTFRSDGHGGTDLILTPIVGVQHQEAAIQFGPGPHFHL